MAENQAEADQTDETPVVDPLDAANSQNSGTTDLSSYEDEIQAMMQEGGIQLGDDEEQEKSAPDDTTDDEFEANDADDQPDPGEVEDAEDEDELPKSKGSERFRFSSEEDKAVAAIAKAKGVTLVEAARIYSGEPAKAAETTQEQQQSATSETVAGVEAEILELRQRYKEATKAIDVDEQAELFEQLEQKRDQLAQLKIKEAEQSARAVQTEHEKELQAFNETWDFTRERYPDLNDPNSAMYKEVARLDAEMQELGDPLAGDPKRLWDLAKKAGLNTRTPMTKPQGKQSPAPTKGKTGSPIKPAAGNRGTTSAEPNQAFVQKVEGLQTLDAYEEEIRRMKGELV
jgi:hypothetical protein